MLQAGHADRSRGVFVAGAVFAAALVACSNGDEHPISKGDDSVTGARDGGSDASADAQTSPSHHDASFEFPDLGVDAGQLGHMPPPLPTHVPQDWRCRPDFALDRVCDCGCGALDAICQPDGCELASCSLPACDACFDAKGERTPCGARGPWLCAPSRMSDGVCDCGCGGPDPDCGANQGCYEWGCNVQGCERCVQDSGAFGACAKPAAWTCAKSALGDGKCDCGCGNLDPDCDARSCSARGCKAEGCDVCRDAAGKITSCTEKPAWHCSADAKTDSACDCGCGLPDPACKDEGCAGASCDASACQVCHDEFGRALPCAAKYTCDAASYADGVFCDCGCGAADPDCAGKGCTGESCKASACDVRHGAKGKPIAPSSWTCGVIHYGAADGCDCGCGALDPDCVAGGGGCQEPGCKDDTCDRCRDENGGASSCRFLCELGHFNTGDGCDCGCGEADPDCAGMGCSEPGCYAAACERCVDEDVSAISCERGACDAQVFGDGVCDCGCRDADPDCAGLSNCTSPECSAPSCGRCHAADGGVVTCSDWYCTLEKQGGDACNCGCGALDPDCNGGGCAAPGCSDAACTTCRSGDDAPMSCTP